jgi:hypothetical protein
VATEVISSEAFADFPDPPAEPAAGAGLALAAWGGGAVILGPSGGLVRLDATDGYDVADTEGIDDGDEGHLVRSVGHLASSEDRLLALGQEVDLVSDVQPSRYATAWTSEDAERWTARAPDGLTAGADEIRVGGVVSDGSGFFAYGEVDREEGTETAVWSSDDGESWARLETPGLDQPEDIDSDERLVALAVMGDTFLAVREDIGLDDSTFTLVRGEHDGDWSLLEPTGLGALDLPNTDAFGALAAVGGQFVLFAHVPVDPDAEFGARRPALFTSADGHDWAVLEVEGPDLEDPYVPQALVAVAGGAIGLTPAEDGLTIWRFTT